MLRAHIRHNVPDHRPRASDTRIVAETQSRGSVQAAGWAGATESTHDLSLLVDHFPFNLFVVQRRYDFTALIVRRADRLKCGWHCERMWRQMLTSPRFPGLVAVDADPVTHGASYAAQQRKRSAMRRRGLRIETQARPAHSLKQKLGREQSSQPTE